MRGNFKTITSQSYQITDKALNSGTYKYLNMAGKALSFVSIGSESYNAYISSGKKTQIREAVSAGIGATTNMAAATAFAQFGGTYGAAVGAFFGPMTASVGYVAGYATGYVVYNFTPITDYVKNTATSIARSTWEFSHNYLHWSS
ncbi:MAG: hypothetical protein ABSF18_03565 [Gammaproteobacteria bacterium]